MRDINARTLTQSRKESVLRRNSYTCVYCFNMADTVDHIVPWSFKRDNRDSNLVASCKRCNNLASSNVFDSFFEKQKYIQDKLIKSGKDYSLLPIKAEVNIENIVVTPVKEKYLREVISCAFCKTPFHPKRADHRFDKPECNSKYYETVYRMGTEALKLKEAFIEGMDRQEVISKLSDLILR